MHHVEDLVRGLHQGGSRQAEGLIHERVRDSVLPVAGQVGVLGQCAIHVVGPTEEVILEAIR